MSIFEKYNEQKKDFRKESDYSLVRVTENILVGEDNEGRVSIVVISSEPNRDSEARKTKKLSFACNVIISYREEDSLKEDTCHIIKCYSYEDKDIEMFLKIGDTFFLGKRVLIDDIINTFNTLNSFFSKNNNYSNKELQGLYGELYAIYYFRNEVDLAEKWQNKDKMKFDFSIDKDTKLEVKTTTSQLRVHHFKHEQLAVNLVDIYILSFKLREDNDGLSLMELMNNCLPLLKKYPNKESRILKVIYDLKDTNVLDNMKFLEAYTISNMKIFNANDIPKFDEKTPRNVTDAEYNSNCENAAAIDMDEMISIMKK